MYDRGTGHSYLLFKNNTSSYITVGYASVAPGSNVSIGLWTTSTIGSMIGSSSSLTNLTDGVIYDYESCIYNVTEFTTNEKYVTSVISSSTLSSLSSKIIEKNNDYNLVTYNCATFATELWNIATGTSYWTGWFRSPGNVLHEIETDYTSTYHTGTGDLTIKNHFRKYQGYNNYTVYTL